MTGVKILIRFFSSSPIENVISSMALEPELLLPVGYGHVLSDQMRTRLNFFFHRRGIRTIVMEPVSLKEGSESGAESVLADFFRKYYTKSIVVDLSGADRFQAMALGRILGAHPEWRIPVLDQKIQNGTFLPQTMTGEFRNLKFPVLRDSEIRFLNDIRTQPDVSLVRKNLNREMVRGIRIAARMVRLKPDYWISVSEKLRLTFGEKERVGLQQLADENSVTVPEEAFQELHSLGFLTEYVRKNHIIQISFAGSDIRSLLFHLDEIETYRAFLLAAKIKNAEEHAAFHDLMLTEDRLITGVYRVMPHVMMLADQSADADTMAWFYDKAEQIFGNTVRRIVILSEFSSPSEEALRTAHRLGMEQIPLDLLEQKLELR